METLCPLTGAFVFCVPWSFSLKPFTFGVAVAAPLTLLGLAFLPSYREFWLASASNPWLLLLGAAVGVTLAVLEDRS